MAEFVVKIADERGHLLEQVESGYSEAEVRDRFVQQGFLVYWVKPRGMFSGGGFSLQGAGQGQAGTVSHFQLAIPYLDQSRAADPEFFGFADQAPAGSVSAKPVAECARPGQGRGVALRRFFRSGSVSQDLHQHLDGGREERQHGRSAHPLHCFSADGADLQEEIGGLAGVSDPAGHRGFANAGVPGYVCGAAVRQALSGYGCATADHHADHAEYRESRAKIFSSGRGCAW